MKMIKKPMVWLLVGVALVTAALIVSACAPAVVPTEVPTDVIPLVTEAPMVEAPTVAPVDQSEYMVAWESGVHGSTYDLGKGPNDYCSRCHSPQNWNPESQVDASPNCVTCKFAFDPELRIAATMNFVDEADWKGITCVNCHEVDSNGVASDSIAWLNPLTNNYETLSSTNELCGKCHANTSGVSFTGGRGVTHAIVLGGSAHLNYAGAFPQEARPQFCSDCHDPHSGTPKACQDCHTDITDAHAKVSAMMDKVECMACHEASGMDVAPVDDIFTTVLTSVGRTGDVTTAYTHSHSIQWLVECDRCHFEGNTWELIVLDATGAVPSDAPAGGPPSGN
jgi:hypothetical protein